MHYDISHATVGYDPQIDFTLSRTGCADALTESGRFKTLVPVGNIGMGIFVAMVSCLSCACDKRSHLFVPFGTGN